MKRLSLAAVLVLLGCGARGPSGSATIGAAGGTVTSSDSRLTLTVPAGALAADTAITIKKLTREELPAEIAATTPISEVYALKPEGTAFASPVTFDWAFETIPAGLMDGTGMLIPVGTFRSSGVIGNHLTSDSTRGAGLTVRTTASHFSEHWVAPLRYASGASSSLSPLGRLTVDLEPGVHVVGAPWQPDLLVDKLDPTPTPALHLTWSDRITVQLPAGWGPLAGDVSPLADGATIRRAPGASNWQPASAAFACRVPGEATIRLTLQFTWPVGAVGAEVLTAASATAEAAINCVPPPNTSTATALELLFPKVDSVVGGKPKRAPDGRWYLPMSTGISSLTVVDPSNGAAPQRQVTFSDTANPVELVAAHPGADGGTILVGSRRFGRPFAALLGADDMVSWGISFGEHSVDRSTDIADLGGGEYVVGFGNQYSNGKLQLARLSATGELPTIVTLGAAMKAVVTAVAPRPGGGYLVGGQYNPTTTTQNAALVAMTATHTIAWQKTISNGGKVFGPGVLPLADGGVLVWAQLMQPPATTLEAWLARFDANGGLTWQRTYGTAFSPAGAVQTATGFLIAASTAQDLAVVQLAADGSVVGAKTYNDSGSTNSESARAVGLNAMGGASLVGYRHANTSWQLFETGADLTVPGCGDAAIGAVLDGILGAPSTLTMADSTLVATLGAPAIATAGTTLPPVRANVTTRNFCF